MLERDVIVRAFEDEPVKLRALALKTVGKNRLRTIVVVGRAADADTIGLPLSNVFEYDESVYALLRRAFNAGEFAILRDRWKDLARPLEVDRTT